MAAHSTRQTKPKKPRKDFPLFPHARGYWVKKVRGKFCYFGRVADDPKGEAALQLWLDQRYTTIQAFNQFVADQNGWSRPLEKGNQLDYCLGLLAYEDDEAPQ